MSDVRKKLLAEIDKKTKRRQEARLEAAASKTLEGIVFDFFKRYDELCAMDATELKTKESEGFLGPDFEYMYRQSVLEMIERIKCIDIAAKVTVFIPDFDSSEEFLTPAKKPQSVTINWSVPYQKRYESPASTSIDVSQMLFY